jgi:hypothetical protein
MIGKRIWSIAHGYIPQKSHGKEPEFVSQDKLSVLNTTNQPAKLEIWIYYENKAPIGPYPLIVDAKRVRKFRLNDLIDPQAIPLGVNYSCIIYSSVPVVIQFSKQYTTQNEIAIMSTIPYSSN